MSKYKDTIYALSTPTGKSAIAVIRVSGNKSLNILKKISSIKTISPNKTKLTTNFSKAWEQKQVNYLF